MPDILCLQEVDGVNRQKGFHLLQQGLGLTTLIESDTNAILTNAPVVQYRIHQLPQYRTAIEATLCLPCRETQKELEHGESASTSEGFRDTLEAMRSGITPSPTTAPTAPTTTRATGAQEETKGPEGTRIVRAPRTSESPEGATRLEKERRTAEINIVCTHFDHISEQLRVDQYTRLALAMQQRFPCSFTAQKATGGSPGVSASSPLPIPFYRNHLLLGDLNALNRSDYSAEGWTQIVNERRKNGWQEPKHDLLDSLTKPHAEPTTCSSFASPPYVDLLRLANRLKEAGLPYQPDTTTCRFGTRIDYALATPLFLQHFEVLSCDIVHHPHAPRNEFGTPYLSHVPMSSERTEEVEMEPSDHFPVFLVLREV